MDCLKTPLGQTHPSPCFFVICIGDIHKDHRSLRVHHCGVNAPFTMFYFSLACPEQVHTDKVVTCHKNANASITKSLSSAICPGESGDVHIDKISLVKRSCRVNALYTILSSHWDVHTDKTSSRDGISSANTPSTWFHWPSRKKGTKKVKRKRK